MMLHKAKIVLLFWALLLLPGAATEAEALTIAQDGLTKAVIVVAKDAGEPQQHAAAELAEFLHQITGAAFDIVNEAGGGKSRLLVGAKAAKLADADFTTEGLDAEGIVIRTVGDDLILAGGRPRGTLYAVYTFLEPLTK